MSKNLFPKTRCRSWCLCALPPHPAHLKCSLLFPTREFSYSIVLPFLVFLTITIYSSHNATLSMSHSREASNLFKSFSVSWNHNPLHPSSSILPSSRTTPVGRQSPICTGGGFGRAWGDRQRRSFSGPFPYRLASYTLVLLIQERSKINFLDQNQNETQHSIDLHQKCVATHNANHDQHDSPKSPGRCSSPAVGFVMKTIIVLKNVLAKEISSRALLTLPPPCCDGKKMLETNSGHKRELFPPDISLSLSIVFCWLDFKMAFQIKSVLDPGTRSRENTRNNGFWMISDWFFYFCVYLDRENRYTPAVKNNGQLFLTLWTNGLFNVAVTTSMFCWACLELMEVLGHGNLTSMFRRSFSRTMRNVLFSGSLSPPIYSKGTKLPFFICPYKS